MSTAPPPADRRFLRAAAGVAHDSLRGRIEGHRYVSGDWHRIAVPLADLRASPDGPRDRQLLHGARFCALTRADAHVFGFAGDDGYCGWLHAGALGPDHPVTHWVAALSSHLYPEPGIKLAETGPLPMLARLQVTGRQGGMAETPLGFVPQPHLRALDDRPADPVAVARQFLGVPYLWGGNGSGGIDCSGLVQAALWACGLACPADSDLQRAMPGDDVTPGGEVPGDLIFWTGHVAMVSAPGRIIHANAHHMAVAEEPLAQAEDRIAAAGHPVLRRLRPAALPYQSPCE